jgi:hypothetical protein
LLRRASGETCGLFRDFPASSGVLISCWRHGCCVRAAAGLLLLAVFVAGCSREPTFEESLLAEVRIEGQPVDAHLPENHYWMVWAHSEEEWTRTGGTGAQILCDIAMVHDVEASARTVLFDPWIYPIDPAHVRSLIATQAMGISCFASDLAANQGDEFPMNGFGGLVLQVDPHDGTARFEVEGDEHEVNVGQKAVIRYTASREDYGTWYDVEGVMSIEALGAWPQDGLRPFPRVSANPTGET